VASPRWSRVSARKASLAGFPVLKPGLMVHEVEKVNNKFTWQPDTQLVLNHSIDKRWKPRNDT
jgi:hypothetical protein